MSVNKFRINEVPADVEAELNQLRKKDKIYTWVFTVIVGVTLVAGAWTYTHRSTGTGNNYTANGQNTGTYGAGTVSTLNTSTVNAATGGLGSSGGAGAGGCCGGGSAGAGGLISTGSGSAGVGGGCCGGGSGKIKADLKQLETKALAQFKAQFGDQKVTAKAQDYGCHIQIDIYDSNNKIIHSYAYRGGDSLNLIN